MIYRLIRQFMVLGLLVSPLAVPSHAQNGAVPVAKAQAQAAPKKKVPAWKTTTSNRGIPSRSALDILVRSTLLTVNDANLTGNYEVLRARSAPSFQKAYGAKKIDAMFAGMRKGKTDLSSVVLFKSKLIKKPELNKGVLRLKGFVPTRPKQIVFVMDFKKDGKRWLLSSIGTKFSAPKKQAAATKGKASKKAKKK